MITGYNTDIEFDGVVYHVQTEDKGLDSPLILTLVYVGGEILASKRSPYHDLVGAGFDPLVLGERLQRQHKLICAAIKAGRIDDLKRLSQRDTKERISPAPQPAPQTPEVTSVTNEVAPGVVKAGANVPQVKAGASSADILDLDDGPLELIPPPSVPQVVPTESTRSGGRKKEDFLTVEAEDALHLSLLEEREFHAGEVVTIRIRVSRGGLDSRVPAPDVTVTVKVLGTEFRPLILTTRSDRDGVATVHAWLPRFTKGRAAVLVRAVVDGYTAELRRIIHQS